MPTMPPGPASPATATSQANLGLRARKKLRTRQAIREAAYRLIEEQGYDNTTIEQIAAAAEVSPSTIFRYFASKEHIILTADFAGPVIELLLARPADEPPLIALRRAATESLRPVYREFEVEFARRLKLVREVPALRAQMYEAQGRLVEAVSMALAKRAGRQEDDIELRIALGALAGALTQALYAWGDHGRPGELVEIIERALAVLQRGLTL
ncbi:TetR/AcrR family transcriptional regulator [Phytohabitans rumicis]|uniref:TetR family transcriptional regulator n=1 Tax=Phytohabitans rumicis TaxID=1076125 RepID=A0A6V8KZQ3_9ACTN|nr:TetR family transcriptional regulator [Phytohabitans rumicis]GFJ87317.1 TetR family transcriptional regulator [Phytohabitans rumicis]